MNWIYFRKISFPTIEVGAFHAIHSIIHLFFWRSSFGFGRLQIASPTRPRAIISNFLLFFIRRIPRGKQLTKMKLSRRLHLDVKKVASASLRSQRHRGWKKDNRYDRPKKLQANSHLWVSMHMQFGFRVILHLPLFFSRSTSSNCSCLLFFWIWQDSTSKFSNRSSSCTIYLSVVKRFCWNKWRAKGVLLYTTEVAKMFRLYWIRQN